MCDNIVDDKISSEENMERMQEEYTRVLSPRVRARIASFLSGARVANPNICTRDYGVIAETYSLERDIVTSLNYLYMRAANVQVRYRIESIICAKKKVLTRLASLYHKGMNRDIEYTSRAVNSPNYNALYYAITRANAILLAKLVRIPCIPDILALENSANILTTSLNI